MDDVVTTKDAQIFSGSWEASPSNHLDRPSGVARRSCVSLLELLTLCTLPKSMVETWRMSFATSYTPKAGTKPFAKRVLDRLIHALKASKVMGKAMKDAFDKASSAAEEFVEKHPVYTAAIITIIAIGVLVLITPWIIELLGFGELGPIEGKQLAYIINESSQHLALVVC